MSELPCCEICRGHSSTKPSNQDRHHYAEVQIDVIPSKSDRFAKIKSCIDPMKICSCYGGEGSDEFDDGRQHQTVGGEAQDGTGGRDHSGQDDATVSEASRAYDLSEIEGWVDDAKRGMKNALRADPHEIREQYEKQVKNLQEAYGKAMLELRARKKLAALMEREDGQ